MVVSSYMCSLYRYSLRSQYPNSTSLLRRTIFSTSQLENLWFEKVKAAFTWKKSEPEVQPASQITNLDDKPSVSTENRIVPQSKATPVTYFGRKLRKNFYSIVPLPNSDFSLSKFANFLKSYRKPENFRHYCPGKTFNAAQVARLEKPEEIYRYLAGFDDTGENLQNTQKLDAARHCNCTLTEVESALTRFFLQKEIDGRLRRMYRRKLPMPTTAAEFEEMIGDRAVLLKQCRIGK